jgi:hypothetical protein
MLRILARALLAALLAMLAACDGTGAGGTLDLMLEARQRCSHCGWIESKEEIRPAGLDPHAVAMHEYKVRMADGSSRVFREQAPVSWRVRERLIFIDANDAGSAGPAASR